MNRIAQFTIALSALFCAAACSEKIVADLPDASDYITVTSEVGPQVKAGYEGTFALPNSFTMTIRQGSDSKDYTMNKAETGNSYDFSGTPPTWASLDASQVYVKAITASISDIDNAGILTFSVQKDQSPSDGSGVKSSDLLAAKTGAGITISGNNINVAFNHLLTKLKVTYTTPEDITVSSITLKNVCLSGKYNCIDMLHMPSENPSLGEIKMFHENNSAEAIFFPYSPTAANPKLVIELVGGTKLECPFSLKKYDSFYAGKQYGVKIQITGDKAENADVTIQGWDNNSGNTQLSGERILWVGTSIPAGSPELNYPQVVGEALNCTVINNSIPGSRVTIPVTTAWTGDAGWDLGSGNQEYIDEASGLSLSYQDLKDIYLEHFKKLLNPDDPSSVPDDNEYIIQEFNKMHASSYEKLIVPYIDGTLDNCTTVIIDHGFNDRHFLLYEVLNLDDATYGGPVRGYNFLMNIKNQVYAINMFDYVLEGRAGDEEGAGPWRSYFLGMRKIILAIKEANPNVRIVIGNFFSQHSSYVNAEFANSEYSDYEYFTSLICYFNEAIAGFHGLDIVNPYKYIWLNDSDFPKITSDPQYGVYVKTEDIDPTKFCPDGVHPTNPDAVQAIADVYIRELERILGSKAN